MTPEKSGSFIAGVFGLVFVLVNAGTLTPAVGTSLRVLGDVAFLVLLVRLRGDGDSVVAPRTGGGFAAR